MSENSAIYWTNEKRTLSQLVAWPLNPRQIKEAQAERLEDSFKMFGQVETIAVGPDNDIYNGHQRLNVLMHKHGPDYEVDVRVSSRPLDERERQQLTVYLHEGATGEWDYDILGNWDVDIDDLLEWGFPDWKLGIEDDDLLDGSPVDIPSQYAIIIECDTEREQTEILDDLMQRGYKCRALVS